MRRLFPLLALAVILAAAFQACSGSTGGGSSGVGGSDAGSDGGACLTNGTGCTAGTQCCSTYCVNGSCQATSCLGDGTACTSGGTPCCSTFCNGGTCQPTSCFADGTTCSGSSQCCSANCTGVPLTCQASASSCVTAYGSCTSGSQCCSGTCTGGKCASPFCKSSGAACTSNLECCLGSCSGGTCSATACKSDGTTCSAGTDCCSTICSGSTCQPVPGTGSCTTLGEACSASANCCSANCQGGQCVAASSCQAYYDICHSNADCCSGLCGIPTGSTVGRCTVSSGSKSCNQDGVPCSGATNCCTHVCVDIGSGVPVCAVASGCRVTGDVCTSNQQCCGGGTNPNTTVQCTTGIDRCDNGQNCNGVGTICGKAYGPDGGIVFQVNGTNNCCNGKDTCHLDSAGIPRCYGGCSNQTCTGPGDCPFGYTGQAGCCIAVNAQCQFSSQCCNGLPCLPDATGVGHCTAPTCIALGSPCGASADGGACCEGVCQPSIEGPSVCQLPPPPPPDGGTTDGGTADGGATDGGGTCQVNGIACTTGTQCCSTYCISGTCQAAPACQPQGGACTATSDCCTGLACTAGTCQAGSTCPQVGQACSPTQSCCPGLTCTNQGTFVLCNGTTACTCIFAG